MSEQVAGHTAAGRLDVQSPSRRPALGHVFANGPVLQEVGAIVKDFSQPTFVDQLLGQRHRRHTSIVVPNGIGDSCFFDRSDHLFAFSCIESQRLFTQNHLARFGGRDCDLGMRIVWRADVDGVDVVAGDQLLPVGFDRFVLPLVGESLFVLGVSTADCFQDWSQSEFRKEVVDPLVSIAMRSAHESIADQSDIQVFHCCFLFVLR